jgi:hypothetical protein
LPFFGTFLEIFLQIWNQNKILGIFDTHIDLFQGGKTFRS